jgi:hypothetical protein
MLSITKVLLKVWVAKFYERNAGLFLFIFFLMFGVVESSQIISYHLSLIYGTLSSPIFLLVVITVWILYMLKCVQFISSQLNKPENNFLFQLSRMERSKQFRNIALTVLLIDAPVLIYSSFIIVIGLQLRQLIPVSEIMAVHLSLVLIAIGWIVYQLNSPHKKIKLITLPSLKWKWPKPFPLFYIGHLTTQLPTVFFFSKVFSIISIYGFLQIQLDHYENRTALMGLLFGLAAHLVMVFEFRKFEERYLPFLRTLPLTSIQRFIYLALVYALILLPEMVMLAINHIRPQDLIGIYLFGIGFLLLSHSLLYIMLDNDRHLQWTLGLFLISFMLVLFKIYWVELIIIWGMAYHYFKKHFYQFELKPE